MPECHKTTSSSTVSNWHTRPSNHEDANDDTNNINIKPQQQRLKLPAVKLQQQQHQHQQPMMTVSFNSREET